MNIIRYIVMKLLHLEDGIYNTRESYIPLHFITCIEGGVEINKFRTFEYMVLKNIFYGNEEKDKYFDLFCRAQQVHGQLCRIVRIWRWKKALSYSKTEDLIGTPLSTIKDHLKMSILQENTKYIFRVSDLLNIWMKALTYTLGMTPRPCIPRNPYIGLDFESHHLYQIYFHIRFYTSLDIPVYLSKFFKHNFNLKTFREQMYTLLREDAIQTHLTDSSTSVLYFDILNMINGNRNIFKDRKIRADLVGHARTKAVQMLKPLLCFYLPGIMSCNPIVKRTQWKLFKKNVAQFLYKNPTFGRFIRRRRCLNLVTDLNYLAITRRVSNIQFAIDEETDEATETESENSDVEMAVHPDVPEVQQTSHFMPLSEMQVFELNRRI